TAERFERLEETVQICLQMWSGSEESFAGKHYTLERTLNVPLPLERPHPYLMIGGGGERKTLRLVARYADACNLFLAEDLAHKLAVLARHCEEAGRDPASVERPVTTGIDPTTTRAELLDRLETARESGDAGHRPDGDRRPRARPARDRARVRRRGRVRLRSRLHRARARRRAARRGCSRARLGLRGSRDDPARAVEVHVGPLAHPLTLEH